MNIFKKLFFSIPVLVLIGCSSQTIITAPNTSIKSSLEEITRHDNDKSKIAQKLPRNIGNMELFNVADYSKRFILGIDLGYGIFYDLKNDKKGSGNIFLYKRFKPKVEDGLSDDVLNELFVERRDIEETNNIDSTYSIIKFGQLDFYKVFFITPPDRNNEQFYCHIFNTGYGGVYLKIIFYYPINSNYGEEETNIFMNSLVSALNN